MSEPIMAAGVICKAPSGRVLLMHRTDGEGWAWPGGVLKDGETAEQAAWREVWEECRYRLGSVGVELMRSTKNGVDFTTFVCPVESEFVPTMNHEHDSFMWADPEAALLQAKATQGNGALGRADSADDGLDEPSIPPSLTMADQDPDLEDDLSDEDADLILSVLGDLEARLERLEGDCATDSTTPVHGQGAAELEAALEGNAEPIPAGSGYPSPLDWESDFGPVPVRV
jgi:8-oxo-dGTP pyrophosphatase MutT (NUDIX family)